MKFQIIFKLVLIFISLSAILGFKARFALSKTEEKVDSKRRQGTDNSTDSSTDNSTSSTNSTSSDDISATNDVSNDYLPKLPDSYIIPTIVPDNSLPLSNNYDNRKNANKNK